MFLPTAEQVEAVVNQLEEDRRLHQIEAEVYPFDDERPPLTEWLASSLIPSEPFQEIIRDAQKEATAQMGQVKFALHQMVAFSSRDWSETEEDAYLYAVVAGWNGDEDDPDDEGAWEEVAAKFGWNEQKVTQLKALHKAFTTPL